MDPGTSKEFPWARLPNLIQQRILSCTILPDGPDTALIVGDPDHSIYLRKVAVPVLLSLGSWSGYCNAMRILYRDVRLDLCIHRRSSVIFLTSGHALRPRNMVIKLRMVLDIKKSLPLFDSGHTIRQSKGKLIKMNIPTALRCMKVHGRLSEVEFLVDRKVATTEQEQHVPEDYLPMAEIQLVNWSVLQMVDDDTTSSSVVAGDSVGHMETLIAPAFLACRAWQSGLLPMFEDGTFQKGATLAVMSRQHRCDQQGITEDGVGDRISRVDGATLMRFWLGGTIVELLDETVHPSSWVDPFTLSSQRYDDFKGLGRSVENRQSYPWTSEDAIADSIENEHEPPPFLTKAIHSSPESASTSGEAGIQGQHDAMNAQKVPYDPRLVYNASHVAAGASKGYDTPSDDGSLSDEAEMRNLHQRYGVGSRNRQNTISASSSSSESAAHSMLIGGTTSPSPDSELETC